MTSSSSLNSKLKQVGRGHGGGEQASEGNDAGGNSTVGVSTHRGGIFRSPGSGTIKAVQIAEPVDSISPLMRGASKDVDDFSLDRTAQPKIHRAKTGSSSRLTGRPAMGSKTSLDIMLDTSAAESNDSTRPGSLHDTGGLAERIAAWIHHEKSRRAARKARRRAKTKRSSSRTNDDDSSTAAARRNSNASSDGSDALDQLQDIIGRGLVLHDRPASRKGGLMALKKRPSRAKLRRPSTTSEADHVDDEDLVPTCDVMLDNSKTLSYGGGKVETELTERERPSISRAGSHAQKDAWVSFKYEIVRLTHTLRLRGWRRVPMQMSSQIEVIRLSGALTNAVYEVLPPKELPSNNTDTVDGTTSSHPRSKPQKLLLRIYGTNVDNLIDREAELQILRRLRRKNIGPRLLGCFSNGRFEEFFHAEPLDPQDLRDPAISIQIAKRMRELHEGIDLLPIEREEGPFVWCNINRWQVQCQQIVTWLDTQAKKHGPNEMDRPPFVCGTEWPTFIETVNKYNQWLLKQHGGYEAIKQGMVFAHNDTQYGNILRMTPEGESPLLTPANQHKRLQVIDFEYANANMPGLEFANHFTEWCYNYHDEKASHACTTTLYPTLEEQRRFLHAYITHKPRFSLEQESKSAHPSGPCTPALAPATSSLSASLISNFMLDSRTPHANTENPYEEVEREIENEITRLQHETRAWRLANSAQWVMWGVLRAKIPDLPDFDDPTQSAAVAAGPPKKSMSSTSLAHLNIENGTDPLDEEAKRLVEDIKDRKPDPLEEGEEEDTEEFNYLAYSWDRAMFFWGDAVGLGLVKKEDLPEEVRKNMKVVHY